MRKPKKAPKRAKSTTKTRVPSNLIRKTSAEKIPALKNPTGKAVNFADKSVTLSGSSHLMVDKPKVIAPSVSEKSLALKTLSMIYQNSEFSGDETKVYKGFMDKYKEGSMKKEDLYAFLRDNPSIRKKIWESDIFEQY